MTIITNNGPSLSNLPGQAQPAPVKAPGLSSFAQVAHIGMIFAKKKVQSAELDRAIAKHRKPDLFDQQLNAEVEGLVQRLGKEGKSGKDLDNALLGEYAKMKGKDVAALNGREVFAVKYQVVKRNAHGLSEAEIRTKALSDAYDQVALIEAKAKPIFDAMCKKDEGLQKLGLLIQTKQEGIKQFKAKKLEQGQDLAALDQNIIALEKEIASLQGKVLIHKAKLKEASYKQVYLEEMPKRVEEGFYNPSIVFHEIDKVLGVGGAVLKPKSVDDIKKFIRAELIDLQERGKINQHQLMYIRNTVEPLIEQYLTLYRNGGRTEKDLTDAFVFVRNLARAIVYQEVFDKSAFPGSDHGAKHVMNNIKGVQGLHRHMERGVDFTDKDEFIEMVTHIYHDIGYSFGLSGLNFKCSKDHPLIGAAVIDANREYFAHYLDAESTDSLRDGILFHSIMQADMRDERRAAVSISDACALTYDRKTQEFWEQPEAVTLIAKLKVFLVLFPAKESEANKKKCDEYVENVRGQLNELVKNNSHISPDKQELFRQAINNQFSAFTADLTLGQYGGVLVDVDVVPAEPNSDGVKYKPHFTMAPSMIYGLLKDLYGEDQASKAFGNLCEEFGLDRNSLNSSLARASAELARDPQADFHETVSKATAVFTIINGSNPQIKGQEEHGHFPEMQRSLGVISERLIFVKSLAEEWRELNKLADAMDAGTPGERSTTINSFVNVTMRLTSKLKTSRAGKYVPKLIEMVSLAESFKAGAVVTAQQKAQLKSAIAEVAFACGVENLS